MKNMKNMSYHYNILSSSECLALILKPALDHMIVQLNKSRWTRIIRIFEMKTEQGPSFIKAKRVPAIAVFAVC